MNPTWHIGIEEQAENVLLTHIPTAKDKHRKIMTELMRPKGIVASFIRVLVCFAAISFSFHADFNIVPVLILWIYIFLSFYWWLFSFSLHFSCSAQDGVRFTRNSSVVCKLYFILNANNLLHTSACNCFRFCCLALLPFCNLFQHIGRTIHFFNEIFMLKILHAFVQSRSFKGMKFVCKTSIYCIL